MSLRQYNNIASFVFRTAMFLSLIVEFKEKYCFSCGPGSSVGIATGYGLDSPGFESRWGRDFLHLSSPTLGPTQPPV